jgi:hypothetical protein
MSVNETVYRYRQFHRRRSTVYEGRSMLAKSQGNSRKKKWTAVSLFLCMAAEYQNCQ